MPSGSRRANIPLCVSAMGFYELSFTFICFFKVRCYFYALFTNFSKFLSVRFQRFPKWLAPKFQTLLPIPQPLELSLYGGVYPCPLSFELSFSTVPRQFPQDLLGVPSEFVLLSGSSRVQVRGSDPSRLPPPSGCPTAPAGSAAAALFMAPIFTNYSPSKLLGDPLLKNPPYI